MKSFKGFLLLIPVVVSSASLKPSGTAHNDKHLAARVVLDYKGSVTGSQSMGIGIQVTIDTLVGVRYEVRLSGSISSHIALFYKFSNPHQTIFYNFLTYKSTVNKDAGTPDSDPNVDVIGKEAVGAYPCTHLQHGAGTKEITDYWMSSQIPGFLELINSLKGISAGLPAVAFNGTIFQWGGLVKMRIVDSDPQGQMTMNLHLQNARINIPLPLNTFDIPSK